MVNGTLSRILYIGALALIGMIIAGVVIITVSHEDVPAQLWGMMTALVSFLFGTHVTPFNVARRSVVTRAEGGADGRP